MQLGGLVPGGLVLGFTATAPSNDEGWFRIFVALGPWDGQFKPPHFHFLSQPKPPHIMPRLLAAPCSLKFSITNTKTGYLMIDYQAQKAAIKS